VDNYNLKCQEFESLVDNYNLKSHEVDSLVADSLPAGSDDDKNQNPDNFTKELKNSYNTLRCQETMATQDISTFQPLTSRQAGENIILENDSDKQRCLYWGIKYDDSSWYLVPNLSHKGHLDKYHYSEKFRKVFDGCPEEFEPTFETKQFELIKLACLEPLEGESDVTRFTLSKKGNLKHTESQLQILIKKHRETLTKLYNKSKKGNQTFEQGQGYTSQTVKENLSAQAKRKVKGTSKDIILETDNDESDLFLAVKYNDLDYWFLVPRFVSEDALNLNSYITFREMFTGCPEWNNFKIKDFELVEPTLLTCTETQTEEGVEIKKFKVIKLGKLRTDNGGT
jgi:hypothetical protein